MPEPVLSPSAPLTIATTNPSQDQPVIAKGFDDPAFLQAAEKAFAEARVQRAAPSQPHEKEPALQVEHQTTEAPEDTSSPNAAKVDRPPTPRKASEWAAFHDAKVKVEKERDDLKSRLDAFNGFDPKEYEGLKTERKTLTEKLEAIALEKSDKFQKYFNGEADNIRALVKSAVGDKADKVVRLLDMPDSDWRTEQLEAITEELTPLRRAKMERAFADMDKLNIERARVIENSAANWKKLQEVEQQEKASEQARGMQIFEGEIRAMSDPEKGVAPFQKKEGDPAWNKGIKERIERAKAIYAGEIPAQERARYAAFSAALPEFQRTVMEIAKENEQLKAQLGKLRTAEPGLEQGKEQETGGKEYEGLSHGDALARMIEKAGGFMGR